MFILLILVFCICAWIYERYNQAPDENKEILKCSSCSGIVKEDDKKCPHCGRRFKDKIEETEDGFIFDFDFIEDKKQNNNYISNSNIETIETEDKDTELYLNNYNGSMQIVEKIEKILNKYALGAYIEKDYVKFVLTTFFTCIYFYGVVDEEHSGEERAKIDTYLIFLLIENINNIDFEYVMSHYALIHEQLNAVATTHEVQKYSAFNMVAIAYLNNITQGKFEEHIKHITTASLNGLITEVAESFESILKKAGEKR